MKHLVTVLTLLVSATGTLAANATDTHVFLRSASLNAGEPSLAPLASTLVADPSPMGVGMASIQPVEGTSLYFYDMPSLRATPASSVPVDSLTFKLVEHYVDIATAPAWFEPEHRKLDYEILLLRTLTVNRNWIEVVVNKTTGQTAWLARDAVNFMYWPDFFLTVFTVDSIDPTNNPIRVAPEDDASAAPAFDREVYLFPVAVKDEWIQVKPDARVRGELWVRWRKNGQMLIRYYLLS